MLFESNAEESLQVTFLQTAFL